MLCRRTTSKDKFMSDMEAFANHFVDKIRHCKVLGLKTVKLRDNGVVLELPYDDKLIGNPATRVVHSGAVTTLMDSALGLSVPVALGAIELSPTLDLRIDYMTRAKPDHSIFGDAEVYRITNEVVFARGIAYQDDPEKPIAHCVATFMRLGKHMKESAK